MSNYFWFSLDSERYDLIAELEKHDYSDWIVDRVCRIIETGDKVFIYETSPFGGIKYYAEIERVFKDGSSTIARLFKFKKIKSQFVEKLKFNNIKGFMNNNFQGKKRITSPEFHAILDSEIFEPIISDSKEKLLEIENQETLEATPCPVKTYTIGENIRPKIIESNGYRYTVRNNIEINLGLKIANRNCENDAEHKSFIKRNGEKYAEAHHLIPFCRWADFEHNGLDIAENIICLCSECHNELHYGTDERRRAMLEKLFNKRKTLLKGKGLDITFEQLLIYYKLKE
ncbi:MAG: HNH endonuclease [Firmicutes bacterium]|nr:HNH endonuclease [Bacillota bacterium]